VSAVARGIAEADSIGIAANAQAATPISNKRFISQSPWRRSIAARSQYSANRLVPLSDWPQPIQAGWLLHGPNVSS
jgi:hypothetical protein